ncbi:hypothetical protein D3C85_912860 [compost metagenome]
MVDLINVETHGLQCFSEFFKKHSGTRQTFVVIARLVQVVAGVDQLQLATGIPAHQVELGLQTSVKRPAFSFEPLYLQLQDVATVVRPWFAIDVANADNATVAWLPWHRSQR